MHSLLNVLINVAYCDKKIHGIRVLEHYEDYLMMMELLTGMMKKVIKNARLKKHKLRKS